MGRLVGSFGRPLPYEWYANLQACPPFKQIGFISIKLHPDQGEILICDFSGTIPPEIWKKRPVVVLTPRLRRVNRLLTVVPLSTTAPSPVQLWHTRVVVNLPSPYNSPLVWVKGDSLMTVSYDRLSPLRAGKDQYGKRIYPRVVLDTDSMHKVWDCVLHGLGRTDLVRLQESQDKEKPQRENLGAKASD